jgi:hypothetical protein
LLFYVADHALVHGLLWDVMLVVCFLVEKGGVRVSLGLLGWGWVMSEFGIGVVRLQWLLCC